MENITFRAPKVEEAQAIVTFYNRVGGETSFLSFEKDEYPMDVHSQIEDIKNTLVSEIDTMILALDGDKIVGIGTINSSPKIKSRHCGELGIVVQQDYQGKGIGSQIIKQLIEWAKANKTTTRIQLDTRCDNELAVKLYKSFGFKEEGRLINTTLLNGTYYDLYVMGMMI